MPQCCIAHSSTAHSTHVKPEGGMSISRRGPRFFTTILLPAGRRRLISASGLL